MNTLNKAYSLHFYYSKYLNYDKAKIENTDIDYIEFDDGKQVKPLTLENIHMLKNIQIETNQVKDHFIDFDNSLLSSDCFMYQDKSKGIYVWKAKANQMEISWKNNRKIKVKIPELYYVIERSESNIDMKMFTIIDDSLYQLKYYNIYSMGHVCFGNINQQEIFLNCVSFKNLRRFEYVFWQSEFTNHGGGNDALNKDITNPLDFCDKIQKLIKDPVSDIVGLWKKR